MDGFVKDVLQPSLGEGRTFDVGSSAEFSSESHPLLGGNGSLVDASETPMFQNVLPLVRLRRDQHKLSVGNEMEKLRNPFFGDVFERRWLNDGETDDEDVRFRVGERSQPVVVLLAGCVEQR